MYFGKQIQMDGKGNGRAAAYGQNACGYPALRVLGGPGENRGIGMAFFWWHGTLPWLTVTVDPSKAFQLPKDSIRN